jgi:hypothetical protein
VSTRAIAELRRVGITHAVREYEAPAATAAGRHERPSYGLDAAAALGVDPRRIFKTLVVAVDGQLAVAIVPVADELDLKAFADALGGRRAEMADPGGRAGDRLRGRRISDRPASSRADRARRVRGGVRDDPRQCRPPRPPGRDRAG